MIYLIGSLRNPKVPQLANALRAEGYEVFDDWFAAGPEADDKWRDYERGRGHSYAEALAGYAGTHTFEFDAKHIERAEAGILYMPAGRSAHIELGIMIGKGKPGFILFDEEPERYDVMYKYVSGLYFNLEDLLKGLNQHVITKSEFEMGRSVRATSTGSFDVEQRPVNENGSCDHRAESLSRIGRL